MKYEPYNLSIPRDKREDINNKILAIIDEKVKEHDITPVDIFNSYTGKGGLHGLDFSDFDNYHKFSEAKKEYEQGQFFTPPPVCREMVELVKPDISDLICDPTCGTGNFFNSLPVERNCYGCEMDPEAVKVAKHLYPEATIIKKDIRDYYPDVTFDYIFGNPPFNLELDGYISQHYFCLKAAEMLNPGGFMVLIVPLSFLNDDFFVKRMIESIDSEFNFILQYKLDPAAFRSTGVESFSTKVMVFQKKSAHLENRPYKHDVFIEGTGEELYSRYIKPLKDQRREMRAQLILESRKGKSSTDYKINKLLYQIKINKKTAPYYGRCFNQVETLKTQEKPSHITREEWNKKKLTPNKVLSYLKRVLKIQHRVESDKIEFVKRDFGIALKAHSLKKKRQLSKLKNGNYWSTNDLILSGKLPDLSFAGLTIPKGFKKLLAKKTREFQKQDTRFNEMSRDEKIDRFVSDFRFIGRDGEKCSFNDIQKHDLGLCLQKKYSLLNWQMGSGKTCAAYAWAKYNMFQKSARNVFIISAAISINLTWVPFMEKHKENFINIESISDIKKIKPGMFVLLSLPRMSGKTVKAADGKKYKINMYKFIRDYIRRQSFKVGLVFDESDEITNPNAKRSKAVLACFRKVKYKLLATGTTTRNNITELYKQLELLYNNSINMICDCKTLYREIKYEGEVSIREKKNADYYNKPFPAYYGKNLFKACFNPSKATVFGIKKHNQDIYNKDSLIKIIEKTIITRLFKEIAGPDKYEIKSHTLRQNRYEVKLYSKIIDELQIMISRYFKPIENEKKENMMKLLRQLNLLIKATSTPNNFEEYRDAVSEDFPDELEKYPLFKALKKERNILPNKFGCIEKMVKDRSNTLVAVGCLSHESAEMYYNHFAKKFPEREVFLCQGDSSFSKRNKLLESFEASKTGILVATQQSLKSSVNIPTCNEVIVEALPWNVPKLLQYCFRFIRFDSEEKSTIHIITYEDTIDMNLFALLLAKERINDFVKTCDYKEQSDLYGEYDVDLDILESIISKTRDGEGKVRIEWGMQKVS